ncbi:MAG TPA: DUF2007 domain-containing protein [Thermoanaerobaculia bacterium]|nr:DUF2007 domain-containing protein [Thermoanaerobaculia bacterium]
MFCPECGSEYREGFTTCADCEVALVPERPAEFAEPEFEGEETLVSVLSAGDLSLLTRARSLLEAEGIPYTLDGEGLQNLFGAGMIGLGYNQIVGPPHLRVREEDEARARELLAELESWGDEAEEGLPGDSLGEEEIEEK